MRGRTLHDRLSDPRLYARQIDRLHTKYLLTRHLHDLQQSGASLGDLIQRRSQAARVLARTVKRGQYQSSPAIRKTVCIDGKDRVLFAYGLTDLIVHGAIADVIQEAMTPRLSPRLYSYRRGTSWWNAVSDCAAYLRAYRKSSPDARELGVYVLRRDIHAYTDTLPVGPSSPVWQTIRELLGIDHLGSSANATDWNLVERVVRPEVVQEDGSRKSLLAGVATGQPISCVLFNLYLAGLDWQLDSIPGGFYARYCDDIVFVHPDPGVARYAAWRIETSVAQLGLLLNKDKERTLYLTAAGRQSFTWDEARGTTTFALLGMRIAADGTIALGHNATRALLRDIDGRVTRTARAVQEKDLDSRGRILCSVVNHVLDPRTSPLALEKSVGVLRRAVTDRHQLGQLDYVIARIVLRAVTRQHGARAFRIVPYRAMRSDWRLVSLLHARNKSRASKR